jgi:hypothetical protein
MNRSALFFAFLLGYVPGLAALTVQDIENLAKMSPSNSVEGFLTTLKKEKPELAAELSSHFTLMKATGSSQDASCKDPRVITYSKDARVVMTFNGGTNAYHSGSEGGESVEMMLFDETEKKFKLVDVDLSSSPPKVSSNPGQCLSCHSDKAGNVIPLWNQFPTWHNAYGAFLDRLSPEELKSLNEFKSKSKTHSRYSFLNFDSSKSPNFPYELPQSSTDSNGNVRLTQQLNERYRDFLNGQVDKNYADDPELAMNIKRALVLEDVCKPMISDLQNSPKTKLSGNDSADFEKLKELIAQSDTMADEFVRKMRPPLNASELAMVTDHKVSKRQLLFRALTGLGLKGRGLATMRPASNKDPTAGDEACYTNAKPKNGQAPAGAPVGGETERDENLNPLFLLALPDEVLGNKERSDFIDLSACRKIAQSLVAPGHLVEKSASSAH